MKKIKSLTVKGSSFFESSFHIDFSEKLNCLMGGRGTGKSTLLYFIQATLDNEAEEDTNVSNILKANLGNGSIHLIIEDEEGKTYELTKSFGDESLVETLPKKRNISLESLEDIFECDVYPALKIEQIGLSSVDRLKLIDKKIKNDINASQLEIKKLYISLRQNAVSIRGENARVKQIKDQLINFKTVEADLKRQREEKPEDIEPKEQDEFEKADGSEKIRNSEKRFTAKILDKLKEEKELLNEVNEDIQSFLTLNSDIQSFHNKEMLSAISTELSETLTKIFKSNSEGIKLLTQANTNIEKLSSNLKVLHQGQQSEYIKLKQKFEKHKEYISKYNQLSKKVEEKEILEKEIVTLEVKQRKIRGQRITLINQLNERKKEIYNCRKNIVDELNKELEGSIKITLSFGGITDEFENLLRNALRGSNLRYNIIIPYIIQNFSPDKFAKLIHEKDFETLKTVGQIDEERSKAIINALYESEEIYEIESLYCQDLPEFFLKVDAKDNQNKKAKEHYKKSDELSTGQRCTTVLPIVFAVSDNPLLIDQPEDNLDNKYISDAIHKIIQDQKKHRQLIFITHNPNIPVLSEAENNVFLNYDEKKSKIDTKGSVDEVKENIVALLEGGEQAFETRKRVYGY